MYLTQYEHSWGIGQTPEESRKVARQHGGRGTRWATFSLPTGAKNVSVDDFGDIRWTWSEDATCKTARPIKVAEGRGLARQES